ncbi:hypothetical protein OE88DRAFT_1741550 [Heliocybe sulcata]|uniref:Uncharacterized protein n=1 Tax=Heliocybe sulcata TaxID=5364 RepID=A0A5C3NGH8_9AGAM|nr:hypothetical protein OE88DRAFT_1741550 [Heliocybe sulcata]
MVTSCLIDGSMSLWRIWYCQSGTSQLGIPWELRKDIPFSGCCPFTGFNLDLDERTVPLIPENVIPAGRAYLVNLEAMLVAFHESTHLPSHPTPPELLMISTAGKAPSCAALFPGAFPARSRLLTQVPSPMPVPVSALPSSSMGTGGHDLSFRLESAGQPYHLGRGVFDSQFVSSPNLCPVLSTGGRTGAARTVPSAPFSATYTPPSPLPLPGAASTSRASGTRPMTHWLHRILPFRTIWRTSPLTTMLPVKPRSSAGCIQISQHGLLGKAVGYPSIAQLEERKTVMEIM